MFHETPVSVCHAGMRLAIYGWVLVAEYYNMVMLRSAPNIRFFPRLFLCLYLMVCSAIECPCGAPWVTSTIRACLRSSTCSSTPTATAFTCWVRVPSLCALCDVEFTCVCVCDGGGVERVRKCAHAASGGFFFFAVLWADW